MILESVSLENFRSAKKETILFSPGVNLLYGNNAEGKTNVLEAIYFFARGKSFRATRESEFVRFGEENCNIKIEYLRKRQKEYLEYRYYDGTRLRIKNGVKIAAREMIGNFCAILFCPDHLAVIKRTPAERREFLNAAIAQISPAYISVLGQHKKLLENKNALLRRDDGFDKALMESYNEELAVLSAEILCMRRNYLLALEENVKKTVAEISDKKETVQIEYKCDISSELFRKEEIITAYKNLFSENLSRETVAGMSLFGIQRDDLLFYVNGRDARQFASQGQQRSIALALKLGEGEIAAKEIGEEPVYLLDDVLGELDEDRKRYILSRTGGRQLLVTACEKNDYDTLRGIKKIFVKDGHYTEEI